MIVSGRSLKQITNKIGHSTEPWVPQSISAIRDMPVKPSHSAGDSQTIYIPTDLSHLYSEIFSALVGAEPVRYAAQKEGVLPTLNLPRRPICKPSINCFVYWGLHLNLGRRFAHNGGCP